MSHPRKSAEKDLEIRILRFVFAGDLLGIAVFWVPAAAFAAGIYDLFT